MGTSASARRQLGIVAVEPTSDLLRPGDEFDEAPEDPFDPASDPVLPEYYPHTSENKAAGRGASPPELVVVNQSGEAQESPLAPPGRAKRQEYRQLFARLRRGG
jgi:hypothetical protein